jgi:branched-subunit amino acid transport protein
MTIELIAVAAIITYGSRVAGLAILPPMPTPVARVLERMPPALFAALAANAMLTPDGGLAAPGILAAVGAALVVTPLRSLPACLVAGSAGYLAAVLVT